ncbi:uncharacterized protein LOC122072782 [Macadamia integrifolia]|uniref:uncharacterized protein LOC122072782 n=1 Tax=Macadamia integrifolia TaxID=60698 RepID=UPI001C4FB48F|nr:uncharacterized protein LOC122072782 [Macadamia integrifolia]
MLLSHEFLHGTSMNKLVIADSTNSNGAPTTNTAQRSSTKDSSPDPATSGCSNRGCGRAHGQGRGRVVVVVNRDVSGVKSATGPTTRLLHVITVPNRPTTHLLPIPPIPRPIPPTLHIPTFPPITPTHLPTLFPPITLPGFPKWEPHTMLPPTSITYPPLRLIHVRIISKLAMDLKIRRTLLSRPNKGDLSTLPISSSPSPSVSLVELTLLMVGTSVLVTPMKECYIK